METRKIHGDETKRDETYNRRIVEKRKKDK